MRTKHYLLFALFAQIIVTVMNANILVNEIKNYYFNSYYYIYIPAIVSTALMIVYYSRYTKKYKKKRTIVASACIAANIANVLILCLDQRNLYYFIATSIVLLLNTAYVMKYGILSAKKRIAGNDTVYVEIMLLISMSLSCVGLFISYVDKLVSICFITAAAVLLISSIWRLYSIYTRR